MIKAISALIITFVLGGLVTLATPQTVSAACTKDEIATSFSWGGKKCFPKKNADGSVNNPLYIGLLAIFNFLAVGVGIIVTGGIVFGAIQYTTANGNASQTQQGITVIVNSVIGLLLFIFMFAILNFLVPGGLFR